MAVAMLIVLCVLSCPASASEVIGTNDVEAQVQRDSSISITQNIITAEDAETYNKRAQSHQDSPIPFTENITVIEDEVIKNYDVEVQINQDSSMTVTENITAAVKNIDIKRGIIRVFPVLYTDNERRRTVRVGFNLLDAKIDGIPVGVNITKNGRNLELHIGDPNSMLSREDHTFTITYKTTRQLGFFEDFDELYWNVTGNYWDFPILSASIRVALPGKDRGDGFNSIEWYSGIYGEKGVGSDAMLLPGGIVKTTRTLSPGEGLTAVYTWPKGLVTPPPPPVQDNIIAQTRIAFTTLLLISLWLAYAWSKWGREPQAKAVIPLFDPPDNGSPAYIGYIYKHMRPDVKMFASSIMGLAVKRAIKIKETESKTKKSKGKGLRASGGSITLIKEPITPDNLRPEERAMMSEFFRGSKNELKLDKTNNRRLINGMTKLYKKLKPLDKLLMDKNTTKLGSAASLYLFGVIALYPFSPISKVTMVISFVAGAVLIGIAMRSGKIPLTARGDLRQFIVRIIPAAVVGAVIWFQLSAEYININPIPTLIFIAAAGVISVMRPLIMARTQKGSDLINEIMGLRLYMDTAEKSRLEMLYPPEETPELFERLLPYALALDVAKTWADKFADMLGTTQYKPTWYVGPSSDIFMSRSSIDRFSSNLESQVASGVITPSSSSGSSPGSSSGSGGSGFSGGGGGGGGGRGW